MLRLGNPATRKQWQETWEKLFETVPALGGAVQALRPPEIGGRNPRPHAVSRPFAPSRRGGCGKYRLVAPVFRGRLFPNHRKETTAGHPFPGAAVPFPKRHRPAMLPQPPAFFALGQVAAVCGLALRSCPRPLAPGVTRQTWRHNHLLQAGGERDGAASWLSRDRKAKAACRTTAGLPPGSGGCDLGDCGNGQATGFEITQSMARRVRPKRSRRRFRHFGGCDACHAVRNWKPY